jgi:hypothetical protein
MAAVSPDLDAAVMVSMLSHLTAVSGLQMVLNSISPGPRPVLPHACLDPECL